jgi:hypothetical protein
MSGIGRYIVDAVVLEYRSPTPARASTAFEAVDLRASPTIQGMRISILRAAVTEASVQPASGRGGGPRADRRAP